MKALLSVYNKEGIEELADFFVKEGIEILSTGGTYTHLKSLGYSVTKLEDFTQSPEILHGRVKTLHPKVHGGILYRRDHQDDLRDVSENGLSSIDFVCVNLYPFFEKLEENLSELAQVEFIDIGGPTMLRAAAKNYPFVYVLSSPEEYHGFMHIYKEGTEEEKLAFRRRSAGLVYNLMGAYDSAVANFLLTEEEKSYGSFSYRKVQALRYGENPHQKASVYEEIDGHGALKSIRILSGKELSYNNYKDLDIAWKVVNEFTEPCCCALKHNTPCGVALGENALECYEKAYAADPVSIFGGVLGFNVEVTRECAEKMNEIFLEVIIAPSYTDEALEVLKTKKNLRILTCSEKPSATNTMVSLDGLLLVQEEDQKIFDHLKTVTKTTPTEELMEEMIFAYKVVKYVKSNAIVVTKNKMTLGIGGGQVNRIDAAKFALSKANGQAVVLASDAFFPFPDVVEESAANGIAAIIQPGGSLKDEASISACDAHGIAMVFTGMRHFKH